tara:strand:- start:16 stop:405 length:390 start_codon:yes stop_codon:yes gene_type:complete
MKLFNRLAISVVIFIALILAGAQAYHQIEGWRYVDSLYFTVITVTTIGYGDLTPVTDQGKIFTIFYSFLGIGMAFYFFSLIGRYMFRRQLRSKLSEQGRLKGKRGVRKILFGQKKKKRRKKHKSRRKKR